MGSKSADLIESRVDADDRFADFVTLLSLAHDLPTLSERLVEAVSALVGLPAAAFYMPGSERLRLTLAASVDASEHGTGTPPPTVRVDAGFAADALAGERVLVSDDGPGGEVEGLRAATLVAVPIRDAVGRPLGLVLAWAADERPLAEGGALHAKRISSVAGGLIEGILVAERSRATLDALPEIATIGSDDAVSADDQLDVCVEVAAEATQSDAAILRLGGFATDSVQVVAAYSRLGDGVGDVIGVVTPIEQVAGLDPEHPAPGSDPIARTLGARTVRSFPVGPDSSPFGVLQLIRRTARQFDDADEACGRIVAAQAGRIVELAQSAAQTDQAIAAARSAIQLLGDALVAGVRTERTLRFVPRLFHDMFDAASSRVWRVDRDGRTAVLAGSGILDDEPIELIEAAASAPLTLHVRSAELDGAPRLAVAFSEFSGDRIVVEIELPAGRNVGPEERQLVVDVAERVAEAMWSAEQSYVQQRQLDRVRGLQTVIAAAHDTLSEDLIVSTVLPALAQQYGADAYAVLFVDHDGRLRVHSSEAIPAEVAVAWSRARHWLPESDGDERGSVAVSTRVGADARLGDARAAFQSARLGHASAIFVPLVAREQTLGCVVLVFNGRLPLAIDRELNVLAAFGMHVGSAVLNARDHERERQQRLRLERVLELERENSRQVRALHEVARTFAASLSLDETMRAVAEAMADRLDVDAVWIRTPDERGDKMLVRAFHASQPEFAGALERMVDQPEPRSDPLIAAVLSSRQPQLLSGSDVDSSVYSSSELVTRLRPFLQEGSTVAVLPVATPNELIGTLTMLSIDPDHALTVDKLEVAMGVASQAALSLDNARLYQQQKHFADVIQESLLPSRLPQIPEVDLGVLYRSATGGGAEVGGDFYDFLELDDGRLALVLGDVTGKGVAAAADTAMTKYIFRALAREHPSPAGFLSYANKVVCEEITPGKFVTLFYAVIDPKKNVLVCGNAGHPEPKLVIREPGSDEPEIVSLGMEGLALGILPDQDYEQREYPFEPGTSLVVYTDGVVEARRNSRLYGQYRLERRLLDEGEASAPQIAFAVYQDCAAYAEDGLGDDVAIVVAQRVEPPT